MVVFAYIFVFFDLVGKHPDIFAITLQTFFVVILVNILYNFGDIGGNIIPYLVEFLHMHFQIIPLQQSLLLLLFALRLQIVEVILLHPVYHCMQALVKMAQQIFLGAVVLR